MKRMEQALVYRERARVAPSPAERDGLLEKAYALAGSAPGVRPPELCLFCLTVASLDTAAGELPRLPWLRRGLEAALAAGGLLPVTPDCLRELFFTLGQPPEARLLWGVACVSALGRLEPGPFPLELRRVGQALGELWAAADSGTREAAASLLHSEEMAGLLRLSIWEQGDTLAEQALREGLPGLTAALTGSWRTYGLTRDWPEARLARLSFLEGVAMNRLGRYGEAEKRLTETLSAADAAGCGDKPLAAETLLELYTAYIGKVSHPAARRTLLRLEQHPAFPELPGVCRLAALTGLGNEALLVRDFEGAYSAFTRGVGLRDSMAEDTRYDIQLYQGLYCSLRELGREADTLPVLRALLPRLGRAGSDPREIAHTWLCLGIHARHTGRFGEARDAAREALALFAEQPDMDAEEGVTWQELMNSCLILRDYAGAEETCRRGLARCAATGNDTLPRRLYHSLGRTLVQQHREEEAAAAFGEALSRHGETTEETVSLLCDMTDLTFSQKDYKNALQYARQYLAACNRVYPLRHVQTGLAWNAVGRSQYMLGDRQSALHSYTMALRCLEKLPEEASALRGDVLFNRAVCNRTLHRDAEAAEDLDKGLDLQRTALGNTEKTATMAYAAGEMLLSAGLVSAAEGYLAESLRFWDAAPLRNPRRRIEAALLLTTARLRLEDMPGARDAHASARDALAALSPADAARYQSPLSVNEEAVQPPPGETAKILPFTPRKK